MTGNWKLVVAAALAAAWSSVGAADAATDSPYGACAHITVNEPPARTCAAMRGAGLAWVRSDIDWRKIEKTPGVFDFSKYDRVVAECEAEGVQLLPVVFRPPAWAKRTWEHLDEWAEFVRRFAEHYGRRLPVIEIWNEQNVPHFWGGKAYPADYLAVLRRAYDSVKSVDPSIRVAIGGFTGVPLDFIEGIYRLGGANAFDIMNVHAYTTPFNPEGILDDKIEKLRALMAKYGDGQKPIWITEIGYSTHTIGIKDQDVLLAGLKAARPEAESWRTIYIPSQEDVEDVLDGKIRKALLDILPEGSDVEVCHPADVAARLAQGDLDLAVYPFSEEYAADSVDAVLDFVRKGGVLVDFGGMPMYKAFRLAQDGTRRLEKDPLPSSDLKRFRIAMSAWWIDDRYPMYVQAFPTAAATGVEAPPKGFKGERFFTDALLEPGDEFIPLLSARTNGVDAVAAAVYKFGSDMKGAVVVSGILNPGSRGTNTEEQQAKRWSRALGIAFAEEIDRIFVYEFRQADKDPGHPNSFFGLVHDNFAPKPALGAYMTFVDARPAGSAPKRGAWRTADGKIWFPQWTRPDGRDAGMLWTVGAPLRREVEFSSQNVEFIDAAGAKVRPSRKGCAFSLEITDSPLYFIGGELRDSF